MYEYVKYAWNIWEKRLLSRYTREARKETASAITRTEGRESGFTLS